MTNATPRPWLNANARHEGFPIYFRRPDIRRVEFESLRPRYPVLLTIEHQLAQVEANGLPEPDYNDSLEPLDSELISPFRDEVDGLVALVETFAGRRIYYIYLSVSFDADHFMDRICARFPRENLSWRRRDDPTWRLLNGYATDFSFA